MWKTVTVINLQNIISWLCSFALTFSSLFCNSHWSHNISLIIFSESSQKNTSQNPLYTTCSAASKEIMTQWSFRSNTIPPWQRGTDQRRTPNHAACFLWLFVTILWIFLDICAGVAVFVVVLHCFVLHFASLCSHFVLFCGCFALFYAFGKHLVFLFGNLVCLDGCFSLFCNCFETFFTSL